MAEQSFVEVGNAIIVLICANDPFSDGLTTGWIEALIENCPQTFRSLIPEERMTISPEA